MARKLEEVADILYTMLNDEIAFHEAPFHYFSLPTLYVIADRVKLSKKQIDSVNRRLRNYGSILIVNRKKAVVITKEHYRKLQRMQ